MKINGCFSGDGDWDGQSYRNDWPGTDPNAVRWTGCCTRRRCCSRARWRTGTTNYSTIAFETDLPRIEAADSQDNPPFCDRTTGANCVNPPNGAQFYPFFTTALTSGSCTWQEGGRLHPRHDEPLRRQLDRRVRPAAADRLPGRRASRPSRRYNNFNSGDLRNPCRVRR